MRMQEGVMMFRWASRAMVAQPFYWLNEESASQGLAAPPPILTPPGTTNVEFVNINLGTFAESMRDPNLSYSHSSVVYIVFDSCSVNGYVR